MFVGLSLRDYIDPARDKGEALEVAARNIRESDSGREQFVAIFFVGLYYSFERTGRLKWSKTFSLAGLRKFERLSGDIAICIQSRWQIDFDACAILSPALDLLWGSKGDWHGFG